MHDQVKIQPGPIGVEPQLQGPQLEPGHVDLRLHPDLQTANAVETLRRAAEILEPHGLVIVLEPLNPRDHPGQFLTRIPQAYQICRAVDSPACKILDDLYHQQITEGNLIPNLDAAWDEIAYFQIGDNPGRKEPTTGEINYRNVFAHIRGKGYDGILGMEHGKSREGIAGEKFFQRQMPLGPSWPMVGPARISRSVGWAVGFWPGYSDSSTSSGKR